MINLGVIKVPQSQLFRLHNQSKIAQFINFLKANNIPADEYYKSQSVVTLKEDKRDDKQLGLFNMS